MYVIESACCRWQGPSGAVINARGRIRVADDCHLMMNAVDTQDAGNYTCYARNTAATKSISVMLTVAGARDVIAIMTSS